MRKKLFLVFLMVLSVFLPAGSTSALTTTELYNNAANNIFFYVKNDDACNPSTLAEYVATVTGDQITWIGDAYSVYAREVINMKYPGVSIFAEKGRNFSETGGTESGIEVAKRLADNNALRKFVVFMLGTNGGDNKSEDDVKGMISDLISAVGEDRRIVLMTPYTRTRQYKDFGKTVKSVANSNDKVLVADWAEVAKDKIDEYFEDGVNTMTERGLNMLVATVSATLDSYVESLKGKATSTVGVSLNGTTSSISGGSATAEGNALIIANILRGAGYDGDAIAAFLGNLKNESGLEPRKLQGGKLAEDSFNLATWSGRNSLGFGIAQWTTSGRQDKLIQFAKDMASTIFSLEAQASFIINEVNNGYKSSSPSALNGKGIEYATFQIYRYYETPLSSLARHSNNQRGVDCLPSGGCSTPLSQTETAEAYKAYNQRLADARAYLALIEANGIAQGSGIQWSGGGAAGSNGAICSTNIQGAAGLAMLARQMSWPNDNGTCLTNTGGVRQWRDKACYPNPRDKYKQVVEELKTKGINIPKFMDCSYFIAAVIRYSGLDDNWPAPGGSAPAWRYANSEKGQQLWAKIENLGNTSNLMPGDVFTYPRANDRPGHVMMYIGEYGGTFGNMAGASLDNNVAMVGKIYFTHADNGSGAGTKFTISRYKGSATVDLGTSGYIDTSGDVAGDSSDTSSEASVGETTSKTSNSCGASKVSQGKVYKDEMDSSQIDLFARVIDSTGCKSLEGCKAAGSFILIKYEREKSSGGTKADLASYLSSKYSQYTNTSSTNNFAKSAAKSLIESGDRTLPANTVEMLAPDRVDVIKIDGTDATKKKGGAIKKSELSDLIPGTSTGIINGYSKELRFFCAAKDSSGNYIHLFWQKDNTPSGQETK